MKTTYQTYPAYQYKINNTTFVVWNGSFNSIADWYISIIYSDFYFSDDELDGIYRAKKDALKYITTLINRKEENNI